MAKGTITLSGSTVGTKMESLEVEQATTGGVAGALKVDNNDTDKQAIVVEDSVAGVTAAVAAGMKCIGFVGGGHYADDRARAATRLYDAGADIVLSDMMELSNALGEA